MFPLSGGKEVYLSPAGLEGAHTALGAKEEEFRDVAEIETDPATVGAAVFADFIPDEVGLIGEAPGAHDFEPFHEEGVGNPEVEMGIGGGEFRDGQLHDLIEMHGGVTQEPAMLRRDFAGAVLELPGGICQNCRKGALLVNLVQEILARVGFCDAANLSHEHLKTNNGVGNADEEEGAGIADSATNAIVQLVPMRRGFAEFITEELPRPCLREAFFLCRFCNDPYLPLRGFVIVGIEILDGSDVLLFREAAE